MFSFVQHRFEFYTVGIILMIFSLVSPFLFRLNLGIDMTGGVQIEYAKNGTVTDATITRAREEANKLKKEIQFNKQEYINDVTVYKIAGEDKFVVEAGFNKFSNAKESDLEAAKTKFNSSLSNILSTDGVTQARYVNIGESFGDYIKKSGVITLVLSILMIAFYIQYAFRGSIEGMASWPFALVTAASLVHDVIIAFGLYVLTSHFFPEFKIDTFFLTAMLTILGYSINDTIVVMDRIRSNLREGVAKHLSFPKIIDTAIHDTLTRSIFTSMTVVIVLVAMFFFGPTSLKGFTLALIYGTLVGTYSSVFLAAPMLVDITKKK